MFHKGKTATLNEVTEVAAALEAQQEKLDQGLKSPGPEAMEVDAVHTEPAGATLASLQKKIDQLSVRVAKAEAQSKQRQQTKPKSEAKSGTWRADKRTVNKAQDNKCKRGSRTDHKWTKDGKPVCNHCKQPGHFYCECASRLGQAQHSAAPWMQQQQKQQLE